MRTDLQPGSTVSFLKEVFTPEPEEEASVGLCASCGTPVLESEAVDTHGQLFHEDCAERLWPYNPARDPGIPKY